MTRDDDARKGDAPRPTSLHAQCHSRSTKQQLRKRPVCLAASLIIPGSILAILLLLPFFSSQLTMSVRLKPRGCHGRLPKTPFLSANGTTTPSSAAFKQAQVQSLEQKKKRNQQEIGNLQIRSHFASVSNTSPNMTARSSPSQEKSPERIKTDEKKKICLVYRGGISVSWPHSYDDESHTPRPNMPNAPTARCQMPEEKNTK